MQLVNEYQMLHSGNNMPILKIVDQHSVTDEFEFVGSPEDFAFLIEAWFSPNLRNEEIVSIFSLDVDYNITGVFQIPNKNMEEVTLIARDIFMMMLLIGAERCTIVHHNPNLEYKEHRFSNNEKKDMSYLSCIGNLLGIEVIDFIVFGNDSIYFWHK